MEIQQTINSFESEPSYKLANLFSVLEGILFYRMLKSLVYVSCD